MTKKYNTALKKKRKAPSARQLAAFEKIVIGKAPNKGKVLREVGYSEEVANHPQKVTESRAWDDLMEQYLPDSLLAKKHNELLKAKKKTSIRIDDNIITSTEELDVQAVKAGLDMAYKLKGKYEKDNKQKQPNTIVNVALQEQINKALDEM